MRIGNTASPARILPILISILPGFGAHLRESVRAQDARATFIISIRQVIFQLCAATH